MKQRIYESVTVGISQNYTETQQIIIVTKQIGRCN